MPRRTAVVTDSTADLAPEQQADFSIEVVPLNIHFGQESWRDRIDLSADEFLRKMAETTKLPTTSQPSAGAFEETFRALAESFDDIVCPVISSRLNGTFLSATLAAEAVAGVIPVTVVDSYSVTVPLGMQAIHAARLAESGKNAAEIAATLRSEADRYHIVFFGDTLEHLRRSGRIGKAAQILGSALQLKPLLRIEEGQIVPYERTRTRSRAIASLIALAGDAGRIEGASVIYNTTPQDAAELAQQVASATGLQNVPTVQVAPVISAHVGPGILGVALKEAPHV